MTLTHISLFAGVDGFGLGFERNGIKTIARVEWDKSKQKVLRAHYPHDLLISDVRDAGAHNLPYADIISFGSPCQDLSVAGKRKGLAGERSGLFYEAIRIVGELRPAFAIWENVPGAFTSNGGRDFAYVLAAFHECGARDIAWRTLDAQHFGVPQRRRRVFVVADFAGERAGEILFEQSSRYGDFEPRREARQGTAAPTEGSAFSDSGPGYWREGLGTLRAEGENRPSRPSNIVVASAGGSVYSLADFGNYREGAGTLRKSGGDYGGGSESLVSTFDFQRSDEYSESDKASTVSARDYKSAKDLVAYNLTFCDSNGVRKDRPHGGLYVSETDAANTLTKGSGAEGTVIAFDPNAGDDSKWADRKTGGRKSFIRAGEYSGALSADGNVDAVAYSAGVRRLTPTECARLQGFPDDWCAMLSDSEQYRAYGDAVCVNVAEWIGQQIMLVAANDKTAEGGGH